MLVRTKDLTPATGAYGVFNIITALMAVGWTKVKDSDGTTYSSTGTQVTHGGTGPNGLGNSLAWVCMQMPGDPLHQFCIQHSNSTHLLWRVTYAWFHGFNTGSPSATQVPSSTDVMDHAVRGQGTDAAPLFVGGAVNDSASLWSGADGTYRQQIVCDNAFPFGFISFAYPIGSNLLDNCSHVLALDPLFSQEPNTDPYVMIGGGELNDLGQQWAGKTQSTIGESQHFSGAGHAGSCQPILMPGGAQGGSYVAFPQTDPNFKDPLLPVIYITGSYYIKGTSTLFFWAPSNRKTPSMLDLNTPNDYIQVGATAIPWDGTSVAESNGLFLARIHPLYAPPPQLPIVSLPPPGPLQPAGILNYDSDHAGDALAQLAAQYRG